MSAAIAADREKSYSPLREPEHSMYNPAHVEDEPDNDWGILWEDDEPKDDVGGGEDSEEENPRWRTISDGG